MHFAVICQDKPGALKMRLAAQPPFVAYLETQKSKIAAAGPFLDEKGEECGSMFILDVASKAEAEAFFAGTPFTQAGVFASFEVRPWFWAINPPKA